MKCLVLYDIPEDKIRTKVADFCLDYGLDRLQYSAFMGELTPNHQEELMLKLRRKLGKAAGKIDLFPICRDDWRGRISVLQEAALQEAAAGEPAVKTAVAGARRNSHGDVQQRSKGRQ